jgi:hypothetical protein
MAKRVKLSLSLDQAIVMSIAMSESMDNFTIDREGCGYTAKQSKDFLSANARLEAAIKEASNA